MRKSINDGVLQKQVVDTYTHITTKLLNFITYWNIKNHSQYWEFISVKRKKNVIILSSMFSNITIANKSEKTPETVSFNNERKCGICSVDQMARQFSQSRLNRMANSLLLQHFRLCCHKHFDWFQTYDEVKHIKT